MLSARIYPASTPWQRSVFEISLVLLASWVSTQTRSVTTDRVYSSKKETQISPILHPEFFVLRLDLVCLIIKV